MSTDELWSHCTTLQGSILHTVKRQHPFRVVTVEGDDVIVQAYGRTMKQQRVSRSLLSDAWNHLEQHGELRTSDVIVRDSFVASYVLALLRTVPGVTDSKGGIGLTHSVG